MLTLFNSLSNKPEQFVPQGEVIKMYSCGPTVYDRLHIGNIASFIYTDILHRALLRFYPHSQLKHVMNITDVDDKTIKRATQDYPQTDRMEALKALGRQYEQLFLTDISLVGVDVKGTQLVRATENIPAMQEMIRQLVDNNIAYLADDGIYFSIAAYIKDRHHYGVLSQLHPKSAQQRIDSDEYDKESASDFALWKVAKDDEPSWGFTINGRDLAGRPGWHIECSAMSAKYLGLPIDVHTGGIDLKFPHHENEIAQAIAAQNVPIFSRFFVHNEHLLFDGQKMSKSLGNIVTLDDITEKGFDPMALRMMILQGHYRSRSNFSWDSLEAAFQYLNNLKAYSVMRYQVSQKPFDQAVLDEALSNDLATPILLSLLPDDPVYASSVTTYLDEVLGLNLGTLRDISEEQAKLIVERQAVRSEGDFSKADKIRQHLLEQGITLRDNQDKSYWQYQ